MASRNYAQVAPTASTIALNAYIYGYGGHSLVTPHVALKQLWWTDTRIEAKVTRDFVISKLRGKEREFIDRPLAFGEGLTDDTYMDWILDRAKRLFMILAEIGVPDQIFGCIDDSWDDDDLPVPREDVSSLELSDATDDTLDQKFYDMQFVYLLRELKEGSHIDYGPNERIPMEYVNTYPPAVSLQPYDRVHFPARPSHVYMRRKFALRDKETGQSQYTPFMRDVRKAKILSHEHIACCWASYTAEDAAFIMSDFVAEHTLGTFMAHRTPTQLMRLSPVERPILLCEWMHCLADAVACLHHRSVAHTQIRPSNIWIDKDNHIAFSDVGSLPTLQRGKRVSKTEIYDYAAPESQASRTPVTFRHSTPPVSSMSAFSKLRKISMQSFSTADTSSSSSSGGSSTRSNSFCAVIGSPVTPPSLDSRSSSVTTLHRTLSPSLPEEPLSPRSARNFSRHILISAPSPTIAGGPSSSSCDSKEEAAFPQASIIDPDALCALPQAVPEMSDIWSLGCVFLDLVTFMLKGKITDFVKFRTSRVSTNESKRNKLRRDTSFHSERDKVEAWCRLLEEDSHRRTERIYRGVPEFLTLTRQMLHQNATLRPTAVQVRDRVEAILAEECGVEALCCAGREWPEVSARQLTDDNSTTRSPRSPRLNCESPSQEQQMSIATGLAETPPSSPRHRQTHPPPAGRRKISGTGSSSSFMAKLGSRRESSATLRQSSPLPEPTLRVGGTNEDLSIASRAESVDLPTSPTSPTTKPASIMTTSTMTTKQSRRRSSASTATAKLNSWKTRFFDT